MYPNQFGTERRAQGTLRFGPCFLRTLLFAGCRGGGGGLYKLRLCPSYSRRRDRNNCVRNYNYVQDVVQPHKTWFVVMFANYVEPWTHL